MTWPIRWTAKTALTLVLTCGVLAGAGVAVARLVHKPRPLDVTNPIHLTIAEGCPLSIGNNGGVTNPEPDHLGAVLAPAHPTKGLICRYTPKLGIQRAGIQHGVRYRSVALSRDDTRLLIDDMNRIRPQRSGLISGCPADSGQYDIMIVAYPGKKDLDLWFSRGGCTSIDNGYLMRGGFSPEAAKFATDFDAIAGPLYQQPLE